MKKYETKLIKGDCLEIMPQLKEKSFDLILSDPPYGITACGWDSVIPFSNYVITKIRGKEKVVYHDEYVLNAALNTDKPANFWSDHFKKYCLPGMWENIKRILKPGGTVAIFSSQPFTSELVCSNLGWFKYEWILNKKAVTNVGNAKRQPLRCHENILIFYEEQTKYNPQFEPERTAKMFGKPGKTKSNVHGNFDENAKRNVGYPKSILEIMRPNNIVGDGGYHPTQKRTELLEYLIRTHTDQGDRVLDFCMGSGSAGIACQNTGRHFTGIELEEKYYKIAQQRMRENNRLLVIP